MLTPLFDDQPDALQDRGYKLGVFLRKYSTDTRPFIPFHVDSNRWTGNVAINSDADYEGGNLLAVSGGKISTVERKVQTAFALNVAIFALSPLIFLFVSFYPL